MLRESIRGDLCALRRAYSITGTSMHVYRGPLHHIVKGFDTALWGLVGVFGDHESGNHPAPDTRIFQGRHVGYLAPVLEVRRFVECSFQKAINNIDGVQWWSCQMPPL